MQPTRSPLKLTLFGAFQALRDGTAITQFRGDKVRALLMYLAAESDRPHSRAHLCGLLWSELGDAAALDNLSTTLARLRTVLGDSGGADSLLLATRQTIQWNAQAGADVDLTVFLRLAYATDTTVLEQAVALYRGPLVPGFSIPGCAAFDEWLLLTREHCERLALAALETLAATYLSTGAYTKAEAAARRILELDPWRETAHRHRMAALAGLGDRAGALAAYERSRQVLHDELLVEPDAETSALAEQIRTGAREASAPPVPLDTAGHAPRTAALPGSSSPEVAAANGAAMGPASSAQDWSEAPDTGVLYGRADEAAQLEHWLLHDRCRLVAVLGMGGVGKTALAASVARSVAGQFEHVLWRSLLNAPPLDELLRHVLQSLAGPTPAAPPASRDAQLSLLLDGLRTRRCLLVLDNLESLLDSDGRGRMRPGYEGYADLLDRLAHSQHRSCLVLTSRERPQGMARWEADLQSVRALRLEGLDPDAGQAILAARGLAGQAADAQALVQRYSGHPLALKLVAQTVHELFGGTIGDFLREETPFFDDIRAVLEQQLARLSPLEQALLTWLAIEREATTVATLRSNLVQQPPLGTVVEALRALQRRSLLERTGDGVLLQNVVIEYLTERLVAGVCAELLAVGEASSRPNDEVQRTLPQSLAMLNRFALIKAQAKEYVRESQKRMILQFVVDRLLAELGRSGLGERVQAILAGLRAAAPRARGYAGGNLLNILLHAGIEVAGYDFSRLSVWQAELKGRVGAGLNFGNADLAASSFTTILHPTAVIVGPAGQVVVAGEDASDLCLWRASHGQLERVFRTPGWVTQSLAVSPDGQLLAAGCRDHATRVWSVDTGALVHVLEGQDMARAAFSHDGQLLATSNWGDTIRLWDLHTGGCLLTLRHPLLLRSRLAFGPVPTGERRMGAPLLASGGDEQVICVWNVEQGQVLDELRGHEREIECLTFSPDGTLLASGSHDGLILLWDVRNSGHGYLRATLRGHRHIVRSVVFHPHGHLLASGGADGTVRSWDLRTRQMRQLFLSGDSEVIHLAFDPNGHVLAGVSEDRVVRLWEVETGRLLQTLTGYMSVVRAVRFSPDGRQVAGGNGDGRIHLWQRSDGRLAGAFHGHAGQVIAVAFSPDGRLLATAGVDRTVRVWDLAGGTAMGMLCGNGGAIKTLAFSPDGRQVAGGGIDRAIFLWNMRDGAGAVAEPPAHMLYGHAGDVETVAFGPDGRLLVSSSLDRTARLWDVETGQVIHVLEGHSASLAAAAFSPRGDRIATMGYDDTIRLWDVATGHSVEGWDGISAGGRAVAFSPHGDLVAHTHNYIDLVLRDVGTGAVTHTLRGHSGIIFGLDWSPREPILASSAWDGTIRLWNVSTGSCVAILQPPGPYAGMNIAGATGVSDAQRAALQALGAVEATPDDGTVDTMPSA